jgi:hypothetical protein
VGVVIEGLMGLLRKIKGVKGKIIEQKARHDAMLK